MPPPCALSTTWWSGRRPGAPVSAAVIEPRFRALADGEVVEKSKGSSSRSPTARPRTCSSPPASPPSTLDAGRRRGGGRADAGTMDALSADRVWLVDPRRHRQLRGQARLGGHGGLVVGGETAASWIYQPVTGRLYVAERGSGATVDGERLVRDRGRTPRACGRRPHPLPRRRHPGAWSPQPDRFGAISAGRHCAGTEYPALVEGDTDFVFFWRTSRGTTPRARCSCARPAAWPPGPTAPLPPRARRQGPARGRGPPTWDLAQAFFHPRPPFFQQKRNGGRARRWRNGRCRRRPPGAGGGPGPELLGGVRSRNGSSGTATPRKVQGSPPGAELVPRIRSDGVRRITSALWASYTPIACWRSMGRPPKTTSRIAVIIDWPSPWSVAAMRARWSPRSSATTTPTTSAR